LQPSRNKEVGGVEAEDAWVRQLLHADGVKVTTARILVLRVLSDAHEHFGVQEIHTRVNAVAPPINLSTVYRTVSRLEELGLVHSISTPAEALYGLARQPHHHAVCTRCGRVTELSGAPVVEALQALEAVSGYTLSSTTSLTVHGLCTSCRAARASGST
jgi:Fur family transcriptional regulator, ferric uptake regulator